MISALNFLLAAFIFISIPKATSSIQKEIITEIVVIGTVHFNTENYNSDTLLSIFNKINPEVILVECDTSYMTPDFRLKEDIKYMFPETAAITKFSENNDITLRPYDINGRDEFLDDDKRIIKQSKFFNEVSEIGSNDKIKKSARLYYDKIQSMINLADQMSYSPATYINSKEGNMYIDSINYYTYPGLKNLINMIPGFSTYKSYWDDEVNFWNDRNETMLGNIIKYKNMFPGKRIVVLCGFAHKNFLKKNLEKVSREEDISVKEFYEY